jgi:hypothetical protein
MSIMESLPAAEQAQVTVAIGADARLKLARNVPDTVRRDMGKRASMKIMFDNTPNSERKTLDAWVEARFEIDLGGNPELVEKGKKWDALGMRRLWSVLEALPAVHVSSNWAMVWVERYVETVDRDPTHARGYYGQGEIGISYRPDVIRTGGTTDHDKEGDPLHGVNRFDELARHEVGHAVDLELGLPSERLVKSEEAGNWKTYEPNELRRAAVEMVELANGAIERLPRSERKDVIDAMEEAMAKGSAARFNRVIEKHDDAEQLRLDPVYAIMNRGMASRDPWKHAAPAIGGRHYHETYTKRGWVSFDTKAFTTHRVSEYQFRAPGEWFAECYAAFYSPAEPGAPKGSRLLQTMPKTHAWFVDHVDDRKEVRQRAERVRKEFGARRK